MNKTLLLLGLCAGLGHAGYVAAGPDLNQLELNKKLQRAYEAGAAKKTAPVLAPVLAASPATPQPVADGLVAAARPAAAEPAIGPATMHATLQGTAPSGH